MSKVLSPNFWIFCFFAAIIILYHIFGYVGHFGYDDMEYARIAHGFTQGKIDFSNHFAHRWTMLGATALSYFLFGVNDFASSLPAILITLATLAIILRTTRSYLVPTRIAAASLFTLNHHSLFYSDKLMPDIWVALAVLIGLYSIHRYIFVYNRERPLKYALILAGAIIFGFFSKGSILLFIPPLVIVGGIDLISSKDLRFWAYALGASLALFSAYLFIMFLVTGSAFIRFDAISANAYLNKCSYLDQPVSFLLDRIGAAFWVHLSEHYMITPFLFVLTGCFVFFNSSWWKMNSSRSFWMLCSVLIVLSSAYMTISFDGYSPMCLDPRHYLFIIPVAAIAAVPVIQSITENRFTRIVLVAISILVCYITISNELESEDFLYLPLTIIFFIFIFLPLNKKHVGWAVCIVLLIMLSFKPISMIQYAQEVNYSSHWPNLKNNGLSSGNPTIVLTNDVQRNLGEYYLEFDETSPHTFIDYNELGQVEDITNKDILLYTNFYSNFLSKNRHNQPGFVKSAAINYELQDSTRYSKLYKLPYFPLPKLLYRYKNGDLDQRQLPGKWLTNKIDTLKNFEYLEEYSSTYLLTLDSLRQFNSKYFSFSIDGEVKGLDNSNGHLVIQITDSTQTTSEHWESVPVSPFLKSYGHWWPANSNLVFNINNYSPGAKLKAFFWNPESNKTSCQVRNLNAQISIFEGTR